jgi:Protein kinase domain
MDIFKSLLTLDTKGYNIGDEIGGYTLVREIGRGAFSQVFEATTDDAEGDSRVALKIVTKTPEHIKKDRQNKDNHESLEYSHTRRPSNQEAFEFPHLRKTSAEVPNHFIYSSRLNVKKDAPKNKSGEFSDSVSSRGRSSELQNEILRDSRSDVTSNHSTSKNRLNEAMYDPPSRSNMGKSDTPSNFRILDLHTNGIPNSRSRSYPKDEQSHAPFSYPNPQSQSMHISKLKQQQHQQQHGTPPKNIPQSSTKQPVVPEAQTLPKSLSNLQLIDLEKVSTQLDVETTLWSRLHHPHILEMTQVIHLDDSTVIVSELAAGGSLLDYIKMHGAPGLIEFQSQKLFHQLTSALKYLHTQAGLVHRDIKCENILLDSSGNLKLCDFGLAIESIVIQPQKIEPYFVERNPNMIERHPPNCTGLCCMFPVNECSSLPSLHLSLPRKKQDESTLCGSLHYTAPELLSSGSSSRIFPVYSPATDLWGAGCVLYAMLTGTLPFNDTFMPRLQLNIMNGKYNKEKLKDLTGAGEVVSGLLEVDPKLRWDHERVLAHPWTRGGE